MARFNDNTTECIIIQHIFTIFEQVPFFTQFSKKHNAGNWSSTHAVSFARHSGLMNSKTIIFPDSCRVANDVGSASFGGRGGDYAEIR